MNLILALVAAAILIFGTGAPVVEIPERRRMRGWRLLAVAPAWQLWAVRRWHRFVQSIRLFVKYESRHLYARALAVYSMVTRQERFEGYTLSRWRWFATITLAFAERERRRSARMLGYDVLVDAGGGQFFAGGKWNPVVQGSAGITRKAGASPLYYQKIAGGFPFIADMTRFPGNIFFVDSDNTAQGADTAGFGSHPDRPFLTVDFAIGQCTGAQADFIIVLPGHFEDIASGETIDADVQGISIIGVGRGPDRPEFVYDDATSTWDVGASGVHMQNLLYQPSVATVTIGIDIETTFTDVFLEDIEAVPGEAGDGTDEFQTFIETKATCTRAHIKGLNYSHHVSANGATEAVHINGISDRVHIEDFWIEITGAAAVAGILFTGVSTRSLIENGVITSDTQPGIEGDGANTGTILNVTIFSDLATIDAATVQTGMAHNNVKYIEVGNEADAQVKTPSVDD